MTMRFQMDMYVHVCVQREGGREVLLLQIDTALYKEPISMKIGSLSHSHSEPLTMYTQVHVVFNEGLALQ